MNEGYDHLSTVALLFITIISSINPKFKLVLHTRCNYNVQLGVTSLLKGHIFIINLLIWNFQALLIFFFHFECSQRSDC